MALKRGYRFRHNRAYVYRFTQGTCYYCGIPLPRHWHVEDLVPLSRGGVESGDNVVPACPECNRRKATRTPEKFKKHLAAIAYYALDQALEATYVQERYGASRMKIRRLRKAIDNALNAALDVDRELQSRPFPGERLVAEFVQDQSKRSDALLEESYSQAEALS